MVIESNPTGATIYLDSKKNKPFATTPWSGSIEGSHTIHVAIEGYKPLQHKYTANPDQLVVLKSAHSEEDYLGWVKIESNIPEADIYIDDKTVGARHKTPWGGNIEPGKHKIWVTKAGYDEYFVEVDVGRGKTHKIKAKLSGADAGYINIRGNVQNVTVVLDGEVVCPRGPCREPVSVGTHTVVLKRSGYKSYKRKFHMQSKTEMTINPRLMEKPFRTDALVSYIVAAGFVTGGFLTRKQALSVRDDIQADIDAGMPPPDAGDSRFTTAKIWSASSDALYGLGAITFLGAIYYTFREKGPPSTAKTDVQAIAVNPQVSPGYAGLGMEVSW